MRIAIAGTLLGLLCGCPTTRGTLAVVPLSDPVSISVEGEYVHPKSGMRFPSRVRDFHRVDLVRYDRDGLDVSAGYNLHRGLGGVAATIYVYPSFGPLHSEFEAAEGSLLRENADAERVEVALHRLEQEGRMREGRWGRYRVRGESFPMTTWLILHRLRIDGTDWNVKYRFSWPSAIEAGVREDVEHFLGALGLP
jgi:hypothetical protein